MKFTLKWLKQFLDLNGVSLEALTTNLTNLGMEVEKIVPPSSSFENFFIGEVLEKVKHPNADSLSLCKVSNGNQTFNVVCGAPNVRAGLKIVLAQVGALIPTSGIVIKKTKIRGEESEGMICSAHELGLGPDDGNIMELDQTSQVGRRFIDECTWAFDTVIEIAVTPNRPDWLGVYGIARDLAACGIGQLHSPQINSSKNENVGPVKLTVDDEKACPIFVGLYVSGIDNSKPSDASLKALLNFIGEKSISPIVDITNYINYSFGRPMHAYDADKIEGGRLQVRFAKNNEKMIPLSSDKELALSNEDLVVADGTKICALAGVIGDERTKCTATTTNILLEAAVFKQDLVYKTGRRHSIQTESRHRFERGVDLNYTEPGLLIASEMILEQCGGTCHDVIILGKVKADEKVIDFDPAKVFKLTGVELPKDKIVKILENLGFKCVPEKDLLKVSVPSWRHDVNIAEDLVEEIIRINGYDHIPLDVMPDAQFINIPTARTLVFNMRMVLASLGYDEFITWSFMPSKLAAGFNMIQNCLAITNPLSSEMDVLRPALLPNLLSCIAKNNARSFKNLSLFEIGNVFDKYGKQINVLCCVRSGHTSEENIYKDSRAFDFFDVKSDVTHLLANVFNISIDNLKFNNGAGECYHPGKSAVLLFKDKQIGQLGVIHPRILKLMDIPHPTVAFEIYVENVEHQLKTIKPESDYQSVKRDFAFIVDDSVKAQRLIDVFREADNSGLIKNISIFDVFHGEELGTNKKSIAITIILQAEDRTLTSEEIDQISTKIIASIQSNIEGAALREI